MIKVGSLFTGCGGFDLGFEQAGMRIVWQCENNHQCRTLLKHHWSNTVLFKDITKENAYTSVELICGGDPCPIRSRARSIWKTKTPDLSGYFLAVVGRVRPRWVVRENVLASDDIDFVTVLEMLGYRTIIIAGNSAKVTAQNRERDFIVGCRDAKRFGQFISILPVCENDKRYAETKHQKVPAYPVLTTRGCRWDTRDGYIWNGHGLRVADSEERRKLAGFPCGWFNIIPAKNMECMKSLSKTTVARMTGNAVVPQVAEILGRAIIQAYLIQA